MSRILNVIRARRVYEAADLAPDLLEKLLRRVLALFFRVLEDALGLAIYFRAGSDLTGQHAENDKVKEGALKKGFVGFVYEANFFPDEPKAFIFGAKFGNLINKSDAGIVKTSESSGVTGTDFFDKKLAMMRCIGESIERTCFGSYFQKNLTFGSYRELSSKALDPKVFSPFLEEQLKDPEFSQFVFNEETKFGWVSATSLISGRKVLAPAQLAFLNYKKNHPEEPFIRFSVSTGAAAHTIKDEALYRGICEVIERDAFMIFYLNKLSPPIIDIEKIDDPEIKSVLSRFKRYRLDVYIIDMTTDIPVPVIATVIIDRSGVGPAVVVSSKAGFDIKEIILGSIAEAYKSWWARRRQLLQGEAANDKDAEIVSLKDRGLLWASQGMISKIEFLIKGPLRDVKMNKGPKDSGARLEKSLEYFRKKNMGVFQVDLTIKQAKKLGFFVHMILIPDLQPLYFSEKFKYLGKSRLYQTPLLLGYSMAGKINEFNSVPHPHV